MYYCYSTGLLKTTPCATQLKINTKVILIHSELIKSHLLWLATKNRNVVGCSSPWLHNLLCVVSMLCFLSVTWHSAHTDSHWLTRFAVLWKWDVICMLTGQCSMAFFFFICNIILIQARHRSRNNSLSLLGDVAKNYVFCIAMYRVKHSGTHRGTLSSTRNRV